MSTPPALGYEQNYAATSKNAAEWSVQKSTAVMEALLSLENKTEGTWGAIDALADLINKRGTGLTPEAEL